MHFRCARGGCAAAPPSVSLWAQARRAGYVDSLCFAPELAFVVACPTGVRRSRTHTTDNHKGESLCVVAQALAAARDRTGLHAHDAKGIEASPRFN